MLPVEADVRLAGAKHRVRVAMAVKGKRDEISSCRCGIGGWVWLFCRR